MAELLSGEPLTIRKGREQTIIAQGTTFSGRYLLAVLAEAEDGRYFVVTARDMTIGETRVYRRKK
ncbi:hypothetical protein JKI95_07825 [Corynebacterium aquatimens]|uniref:hypothetical protein n=1 Tax=Corynebacterium aquatimens TaxID=1190508 RepID=UPI0025402422|nr:hypothetical protein [Corynebacterium aquatimens]QYH19144.1 hypothetical protein JKI95_07825 [Corynebacterium aquatimens]